MDNIQKIVMLNCSCLVKSYIRIYGTLRSLINVQSVINVLGDKFSKKSNVQVGKVLQ